MAFGMKRRMLKHQLLKLGYARLQPQSTKFQLLKYPSSALLSEISSKTSTYVGGRAAADILGIDYNVLRKLVVAGLVKQEGAFAKNAPFFDPTDLKSFLNTLRQQLDRNDRDQGDEIPLTEATLPCQCSTAELIHMVLNHKISLTSDRTKPEKLPDFRVSISRLKKCIGTTASGALTLSEAAQALQVDTVTISNLMTDGFLSPALTKGRSSQRWKVVEAASVFEFEKEYISAKALAADLQRDPSNMCIELYKQGVEPLAINGNNRIVFRRRDLH